MWEFRQLHDRIAGAVVRRFIHGYPHFVLIVGVSPVRRSSLSCNYLVVVTGATLVVTGATLVVTRS